jgi:predicted RNase H-like HicB family nuclease
MTYQLNLEELDEQWIAHVADLPGCFTSARTFSAALKQAPQAIADYQAWLHAHGETSAPPEATTPELGEMHRAWKTPDGHEVNAFFAADRAPLTRDDINRAVQLLDWSRADLLAALEGLSASEATRPVEDQWAIRDILNHVGRAERWYLDRLDLADVASPSEVMEQLRVVRARLQRALPTLVGVDRVVVKELEIWSPRKVVRRALWHERNHTAHIHQFRRRLNPSGS